MDALKESVKRAQEIGEGTAQKLDSMSTSIAGLAQLVQESITENNQSMMVAFTQMLQGARFVPGLQSAYSQGKYPLALGFKSPADAIPKHLPTPVAAVTPPPTLVGVPAPLFARTKQTITRLAETSNTNSEESASTRAQGGGTAKPFDGPKQNDASDASQTVPDCQSPREDSLWLDPPNATSKERDVWEEVDTTWQLSRTRFHRRKSRLRLVTTTTRPQRSQWFLGLELHMKLLHQFHLRKQGNKQEMAVRVELVLKKGVI
jgi:hypothetical protein